MKMKWTVWLMSALMCGAAIAGVLHPNPPVRGDFLEAVPATFGEWTRVFEQAQIVKDPAVDKKLREIYKETLSRTYVNEAGDRIMLSVARSGNQIGVEQAHLPDVCYPAQGFKIVGGEDGELATAHGSIRVRRLTTINGARHEPVTYWQTMGDHVVKDQWDKRRIQVASFLTDEPHDGVLFRVSSIDREAEHAFALQQKFVADLMVAVSPEARRRLSGLTSPVRTSSVR